MLLDERERLAVTLLPTTSADAEAKIVGAIDAHTVATVVPLIEAVPRRGFLEVDLHGVTLLDLCAVAVLNAACEAAGPRNVAVRFVRPSRMVTVVARLDPRAAAVFLNDDVAGPSCRDLGR